MANDQSERSRSIHKFLKNTNSTTTTTKMNNIITAGQVHQLLLGQHNHDDLKRYIECHGAPIDVQNQLIDSYPQEYAFSLLLCQLRGLNRDQRFSTQLMKKILDAIETYPIQQMDYCISKFHCDRNRKKTVETIIGEAMTLIFAFFDDFVASLQTGNVQAIQMVRRRYPQSVLYVDSHDFSPLHGVSCALNVDIFKYFIGWHLEKNPHGRGGLYGMNDSGITSLDTLIDTNQNITEVLQWLQNQSLLKSKDVDEWLLIHRAAHSSSLSMIEFFIRLFPGGVLSKDNDGNLPLHLHLGLRYRPGGSFSEQDFQILELLIRHGITNGGMSTIGGLFLPDPDSNNQCTLESIMEEVGENNMERVWCIIDNCINSVGGYTNAPIVHAAIANKKCISNDLFHTILKRYGARCRNDQGMLPLSYALRMGLQWNDGTKDILDGNKMALNEIDTCTNLPAFLLYAATREWIDFSTLYELMHLRIDLSLKTG